MTYRFSAGAAWAFALMAAVPPARAQDAAQPVVITIQGPCVLALNGQPVQCAGVAYMAFPTTHRIQFTAITEQAGWAFSGDRDNNSEGHYTLALDSVVSPRSGRVQAQGQCAMVVAEDGRSVQSLDCQARTPAGVMMLKASGRAQTGANDEDDDDDDDGSESLQG